MMCRSFISLDNCSPHFSAHLLVVFVAPGQRLEQRQDSVRVRAINARWRTRHDVQFATAARGRGVGGGHNWQVCVPFEARRRIRRLCSWRISRSQDDHEVLSVADHVWHWPDAAFYRCGTRTYCSCTGIGAAMACSFVLPTHFAVDVRLLAHLQGH